MLLINCVHKKPRIIFTFSDLSKLRQSLLFQITENVQCIQYFFDSSNIVHQRRLHLPPTSRNSSESFKPSNKTVISFENEFRIEHELCDMRLPIVWDE